jgi:D-beta-D-heptose 7-phosphate kinase/D-beta-D-heptose 1-phosphate adenosyltransferase
MRLPPLDPGRARTLVSRFSGLDLLVVGDVMLDRFIVGRVTRISPEAPVPVVRYEREHARLGGAANVAHNLAALGASVTLAGVVGRDRAAEMVRERLADAHIRTDALVEDPGRPTVEKVRVVTERHQQVARIDYERDEDISGEAHDRLLERIARAGRTAMGLLVSDYVKGTITEAVMEALATIRAAGVSLIVDPKIEHLDRYRGVTLVTPNLHEAEAATRRRIRTDAEARGAANALQAQLGSDGVLITRGEQGMWLTSRAVEGAIPAVAREVADVTGAGDTVVAVLSLALAAGATMAEAAALANAAAGIVVGKFGPATVTPDELLSHIEVVA